MTPSNRPPNPPSISPSPGRGGFRGGFSRGQPGLVPAGAPGRVKVRSRGEKTRLPTFLGGASEANGANHQPVEGRSAYAHRLKGRAGRAAPTPG